MKQSVFIFATLFLSVFFQSCLFIGPSVKGNGNVVEETRKAGPFEKISVSRGMNVYITQGESHRIVVKADENLLDAIETKIEDNTLKITTSENIRQSTSKKVYVTIPGISEIKSAAGSNVYSENTLETKALVIGTSSGSNMKLQVEAGELSVSSSSGSNVRLEGTAETFTGKASSGANIKAEDLRVTHCNATTSSGANLWISVGETFEGKASSGGNIYYSGNPKTVNLESSSGGNLIKK